jgi:hypothetical protein
MTVYFVGALLMLLGITNVIGEHIFCQDDPK